MLALLNFDNNRYVGIGDGGRGVCIVSKNGYTAADARFKMCVLQSEHFSLANLLGTKVRHDSPDGNRAVPSQARGQRQGSNDVSCGPGEFCDLQTNAPVKWTWLRID